jgi:hypothetical protein
MCGWVGGWVLKVEGRVWCGFCSSYVGPGGVLLISVVMSVVRAKLGADNCGEVALSMRS